MNEDDIVWLMCDCYVWPTYRWSTLNHDHDKQGKCGRCKGSCRLLPMASSKEEALEIYFENYKKYPEEIKKETK